MLIFYSIIRVILFFYYLAVIFVFLRNSVRTIVLHDNRSVLIAFALLSNTAAVKAMSNFFELSVCRVMCGLRQRQTLPRRELRRELKSRCRGEELRWNNFIFWLVRVCRSVTLELSRVVRSVKSSLSLKRIWWRKAKLDSSSFTPSAKETSCNYAERKRFSAADAW